MQIKPDKWAIPGSANYTSWINTTFAREKDVGGSLFPHQQFVRDFMQDVGPNRGILLYHGLGVGKTRSAIAIAEGAAAARGEIVVLLPASLKGNFEAEVKASRAKKKYELISYDSPTKSAWINLSFDNKLVIVDEVHTFMSRVVGLGNMTKELCQKVMDAENCRVVALTGTPIINNPLEIAYTLNLVHGYTWSHVYRFKAGTSTYEAEGEIGRLPCVARVASGGAAATLTVYFWPGGFVQAELGFLAKAKGLVRDPLAEVEAVLMRLGLKCLGKKLQKATLFPIDPAEFAEQYVDYSERRAKSQLAFSQKVQGLVSYFESYDATDFPTAHPIEIVNVPMKKIQFGKYITVRQREVDNELRQRALHGDGDGNKNKDMKEGNQYRAFSRAICNFAFPDDVPRPYPSTVKQYMQFVDEFVEDVGGGVARGGQGQQPPTTKEKDAIFIKMVAAALKTLELKADEYLSRDGLAEYGPKMLAILDRLETCPGPALVYSTYRNVEGLKILSLAMEHDGYVELKVRRARADGGWKLQCSDFAAPKKYIVFGEKKEETRILVNLFNSNFDLLPPSVRAQLKGFGAGAQDNLHGAMVKALLITQSGAQGISLKNVRQVHIMEPFWNKIRIQQVRGRAVRAFSHAALPPAERDVRTFMYVMSFEDKKQREHPLVKAHDEGLSSDGYLLALAEKKAAINDQFLQLLRNASVDCALNKAKHGKAVRCYKAPVYKAFKMKKLGGREFRYLANPSPEESEEYGEGRGGPGAGWTGLFAEEKPVGVVRLVDGKVAKLVIFPAAP